jgi:hypothetical protein
MDRLAGRSSPLDDLAFAVSSDLPSRRQALKPSIVCRNSAV